MTYSIKKPKWALANTKVTSEDVYFNRRKFLKTMSAGLGTGLGALTLNSCLSYSGSRILSEEFNLILPDEKKSLSGYQEFIRKWNISPFENNIYEVNRSLTEPIYPLTYNNYYEFSQAKDEVAPLAQSFTSEPWMLRVHGLVDKEINYDLDDLVKLAEMESRIYRHRCVEAWAMTVPWIGYPLSKLLDKSSPTSQAKYVKFTSFLRPEEAQGQTDTFSRYFPYYEGLTLQEAMNELTLLTFGMYDRILPKQNGAPLRIVIPWKYGYKGPKGVVDIELVESKPKTFWSDLQPTEYPFESNVDPNVPHPRWSQKGERLLGPEPLEVVPTQIYNGYGDYVSHMYSNLK